MESVWIDELARLRPQLISFAKARLHRLEDAEDAVQETLLAALARPETYAGASALNTWLVGILKHKIVDRIRGAARHTTLDADAPCAVDAPAGSDPERDLARVRLGAALERALARLPADMARALVMRELFGAEVPEVCAELGITPSNCWVMLHRGRARLRASPEVRDLAQDLAA